jgi:putative hemolysin
MPADPFQFQLEPTSWIRRAGVAAIRPGLSRLLGLRMLGRLYEQVQHAEGAFEERALRALGVEALVPQGDLAFIPSQGPLVVAANHPHGALDGLLLARVLRQRRTDTRILANFLLARIPELCDLCFFVDPFGGRSANERSRAGLRAAERWLHQGKALIVFPAGEVAHRHQENRVIDSSWQPTVARLARTADATVLPVFIEGANSRLFYAIGRLHRRLRTALLARELVQQGGGAVTIRVGRSLSPRHLASQGSALSATRVIRDAVEHLRDAEPRSVLPGDLRGSAIVRGSDCDFRTGPLLATTDLLGSEIESLPADNRLAGGGPFQVFIAEASRIPYTLREIGRLREITYRAVGEGTGHSLDLDRFDRTYLHLFSWNTRQKQIVGAYRIGRTDRIVEAEGVHGLYTRTLFRYDDRLFAGLPPALELGRAFIRAEYQKDYNALLMLWKGIGQFVARNPQYRLLFGPVSISARYTEMSQRLLMAFLEQNYMHQELAAQIDARHPRSSPQGPVTVPRSIEEVQGRIAAEELDGKGIPVLLRQYLKLNARVLGFNIDPTFGDALDALMLVDLTTVDRAILNRYLGRTEAAAVLARHQGLQAANAA